MIANKLYAKSLISAADLEKTSSMSESYTARERTVSFLLNLLVDRIRVEPRVFTEFVKILESEPTLRPQAKELLEKYHKGNKNYK